MTCWLSRLSLTLALCGAAAGCASSGYTPLGDAAQADDMAKVRKLLDRGADPGAVGRLGPGYRTPRWAWLKRNAFKAARHDDSLLRLMVERCAQVYAPGRNCSGALIGAVWLGDSGLLEALLDRGAPIDEAPGAEGRAPLGEAVLQGSAALTQLLLERGAQVDPPDASGQTALTLAVLQGRVDLVGALLAKGADVNAAGENRRGSRGLTALAAAASTGNAELAGYLVERGGDVSLARANLQGRLEAGSLEPESAAHDQQGLDLLEKLR
ncbi:MAG: ankyrin repeat domain-containing protein [Elusimicrobiota bacterium]|mgnify:CR=1 FL=1